MGNASVPNVLRGAEASAAQLTSVHQKFVSTIPINPEQPILADERHAKLQLCYTCLKCNYRNMKYISKQAYKKGVVIVKCDDCQNNHLIADNLNWFTDKGDDNNVEAILRKKGQSVLRISSEEFEFLLQDTVKQLNEAKECAKKLLAEKAEKNKQSK